MPSRPHSALLLTVEQFEERLAEGDRWIELVDGRLIRLDPPDEIHGDVVRNLSQRLAAFLKASSDTAVCFELGLVLSREPATVRCPAFSCFQSGDRFAETEKLVTDTRPKLVIEVASTNDRREGMSDRVRGYLDAGITGVWVVDPATRHVHQFQAQGRSLMLKETEELQGSPILSGFRLLVADLFRPPEWARS